MKNSQRSLRTTSVFGFTLIELMVVIAIIAILTAIITANFAKSKASARDAKRVSDLAQIQLDLELYFDRCNAYPPALTLTSVPTPNTCPSGINLGTFMSAIPTPPTGGEPSYPSGYGVNPLSSPVDYVLKTTLETNSTALVGITHTYYVNVNPPIDCTAALAYCVTPK